MKKLPIFLWAAALLAAGCAPQFDSQSFLDKFRIVAVKTTPAAARPGETVTFEPLLSPARDGRSPILVWLSCVPLPSQTGRQCLEAGGALPAGFDRTLSLAAPELDPEETEKTVYVILLACAGNLVLSDFSEGEFSFCDSEENDLAIKTVKVRPEGDAAVNHNPQLVSFALGGAALGGEDEAVIDCREGCEKVTLLAAMSATSAEHFTQERFGEPVSMVEDVFVSWFADAGELENPRSYPLDEPPEGVTGEGLFFTVEWIPPLGVDRVTFWVTAYDQRGGVDFRSGVAEIEGLRGRDAAQ